MDVENFEFMEKSKLAYVGRSGLCWVRSKKSLGQTMPGCVGSTQMTDDLSLSVLTHT